MRLSMGVRVWVALLVGLSAPVARADEGGPPPALNAPTTPPTPLSPLAAEYPAGLAATGPARVLVRVAVAADGTVADVSIIEHAAAPFEQAAREAALRARFSPATRGGVPVSATVDVAFDFAAEAPSAPPAYMATVRAAPPVRSASHTTVAAEMIQAAPRAGMTDVLRLVPGLVASSHGGEGKAQQLFLRGFDAIHGQDVEVEAAGVPVNAVSNIHALGYADTNFLIPEAIRAIDVEAGSYLASQGDFAVAGTLRFRLGLAEPGLLFSGTLGQYGYQRFVAGYQSSLSEDSFAIVELGQGNGFGPRRSFGRASALAQMAGEFGGWKLRAFAGSYGTRFDSPSVIREDDLAAGRVGFFDSYTSREGGTASRHQALVEAEWPRTGEGRTKTSLYAVRSDLKLRQNFTGFFLRPLGDGLQQTSGATTIGLRFEHRQLLRAGALPLAVELGGGARGDSVDQEQRSYRDVDGTFVDDSARRRQEIIGQLDMDAYAEGTLALGDWELRLGVRADAILVRINEPLAFPDRRFYEASGYERSAFGVHVGGKAGITRRLGEQLRLFLNYGDGFRSPQAAQLSDGERAPFVDVHGGELGARWQTSLITLSGAAFASYVADDVYFDHMVATTVYAGATLRSGLTAAVTARPIERLLLAFSGTAAHALVLKKNTLLPGFAPFVARGDAGYSLPFVLLGQALTAVAGTGLTFVGPRSMQYGEFGDPYFLVDARVGLRWKWIELRLDVKNLLDARWKDGNFVYPSDFRPDDAVVSSLPSRQFTAGAPRTGWLALDIHL